MTARLSPRLQRVVNALPLTPGLRVLEVGGAPGAAAREVAARVGRSGHVLVVDRSPVGIERTRANCAPEIASGILTAICAPVEDFTLEPGAENRSTRRSRAGWACSTVDTPSASSRRWRTSPGRWARAAHCSSTPGIR